MVNYYDQVKGPQGDTAPDPYNVKWEDEARADAAEDSPVARTTRTGAATVATNLITLAAHGLVNGQQVILKSLSTVTGVAINTTYYVVGVTANTFQLSLTPGGAAIDLTGADGNVTFLEAPDALVGTPFVPSHFFDPRDGAVTAQPVRASS